MGEHNTNLWAPWRMEYIRSFRDCDAKGECFLCKYWASPDDDARNRVVWRGPTILAVLNRFPYTNGHMLIATGSHKAGFEELTDEEICALGRGIRDGISLLKSTIRPQGFNVGYNLGHCAGAGLPGHLHAHIVPRWTGDTNFMAVLDDIRIIPESLQYMWEQLHAGAVENGLNAWPT
jgi:ATP adenylyltransferase